MTSHVVLTPVKAAVVVRAAPLVVGAGVALRLITTIHAVTIFQIRGNLEGVTDA
jgi:hypothetical protein